MPIASGLTNSFQTERSTSADREASPAALWVTCNDPRPLDFESRLWKALAQ
jgi:hypothetical protein